MATDALPASNGSPRAVGFRTQRIERALRMRDVIDLAAAGGYSDQEIADLLSQKYEQEGKKPITRRQVSNLRSRALEMYQPDQQTVEKVRANQLQTLDLLKERALAKALSDSAPVRHIEAVLKIESMRAELLGTRAPRRLEHGGQIEHIHEIADPDEVGRLEEAFRASYDVDGEAEELTAGELLPGD